jgi:hypothetical protein
MSKPTLLVAGNLKRPNLPDVIPVDYITQWVVSHNPDVGDRARPQDRILIVMSQTGSGKSTILPVALFRLLRSKDTPLGRKYLGKDVLCTQPRVATAVALATQDIPKYNPDMIIKKTIGYQTGPATEKPEHGLIFATVGVLTQQLRTMEDSAIMARYKFIIVDEAHERSKDVDVTLMRLKMFYMRNEGNPKLPFLLLASATIDVGRYAAFFGLGNDNTVIIEGRTFPITDHFPEKGTNDFVKEAADVAIQIHEASDDPPEKADILIFAPGEAEIKDIVKTLRDYSEKSAKPFLVLIITREAVIEDTREYQQVFVPHADLPFIKGRPPVRRILVATNVVETGLTVHTLRYVIDSGWAKSVDVYQPYGIAGLIARPAPRSRILQRKGRAGRVFPGDFYPLYTRNVYESLEEQQLPEIITDGVMGVILDLVGEQQRQKLLRHEQVPEFRVEDIDMLDIPPVEALRSALEFTLAAGFVSPSTVISESYSGTKMGYGLTWMGKIAGRFSRTPLEGVRAILSCYVWGCSILDMITIVALFGKPIGSLLISEEAKKDPRGSRAVYACLPPFLSAKFGGLADDEKGIQIPPSEAEMTLYRSRLIVADDFIEELLIVEAFIAQLNGSGGNIGALGEWCANLGLSVEALIDVVTYRETIIEEALIAGLDPFWGGNYRIHASTIETFTSTVMRIKRCLYDGLRSNLLKYDEKSNTYRMRFGLEVEVPAAFTDKEISKLMLIGIEGVRKPQYILTDKIEIKLNKRSATGKTPIIYRLKTSLISVLDGFVNVDADYLSPRLCLASQ